MTGRGAALITWPVGRVLMAGPVAGCQGLQQGGLGQAGRVMGGVSCCFSCAKHYLNNGCWLGTGRTTLLGALERVCVNFINVVIFFESCNIVLHKDT